MSIENELVEAYQQLSDSAPTAEQLNLRPRGRQATSRRHPPRPIIAAAVVAVIAVAPVVYLRAQHRTTNHRPAAAAGGWPDAYLFGPDSLPGYTMDRSDTSDDVTNAQPSFSYSRNGFAPSSFNGLSATLSTVGAANLGYDGTGTPVTVRGKAGFYQAGSGQGCPNSPARDGLLKKGLVYSTRPAKNVTSAPPIGTPQDCHPYPSVSWPLDSDLWAVLVLGHASYRTTNGVREPASVVTQQDVVSLAESAVLVHSATVAPFKIGYLPGNLALTGVYQIVGLATEIPDGRFGRVYRDLMFIDRSVSHKQFFTLDVSVLLDPQDPLTIAHLPDTRVARDRGPWSPTPFDPAKQWTAITIAGHPAFLGAHEVIVDLDGTEVHVSNTSLPYGATPLLAQSELLKVAASLTLPTGVDGPGNGFALSDAVPAANLH